MKLLFFVYKMILSAHVWEGAPENGLGLKLFVNSKRKWFGQNKRKCKKKLFWFLCLWTSRSLAHLVGSYLRSLLFGGLRSEKIPQIPKPQMSDGKYSKYQVLVSNLQLPVTKTANTKTANNEGRLFFSKNYKIKNFISSYHSVFVI